MFLHSSPNSQKMSPEVNRIVQQGITRGLGWEDVYRDITVHDKGHDLDKDAFRKYFLKAACRARLSAA